MKDSHIKKWKLQKLQRFQSKSHKNYRGFNSCYRSLAARDNSLPLNYPLDRFAEIFLQERKWNHIYDRLIYQEVHYENDLVVHHHHWANERSSGDREK